MYQHPFNWKIIINGQHWALSRKAFSMATLLVEQVTVERY